MGRPADQEQKLFLADGNELDVGRRDRGGAARRVIDQRHLAEYAAFRQGIEQAVAEADFDGSALDDEQLLGLVALLEDDVAGFVGADRGASAGQQTEINGLSAIAIPRPLLIRSMIQSHDGGLLQPYDNGSAGFRRRGTSTGAPLKMLTATNEEVRVHPASPVVFVAVPRRSLQRRPRRCQDR